MIENACFTEDSFTMSLDIETNQWYDADGLSDSEVYYELTSKMSFKMMHFITSVFYVLKDFSTTNYKGHNCIDLRDVKNAVEMVWNPDVYGDKDFYECELMTCFNEICPVVGCEVNVVGVVLIQNKEWLGSMTTKEIIEYMKTFRYYNTVPKSLKEGYYAIDANSFDGLLQKFYNYHKKDNSIGLIVAHNINYEWNQLLRHSETMKKWVEKGILSDSPMSGNARNTIKSLDVMDCKLRDDKKNKFDRRTVISFRDTFLYCTTSLRRAGAKFGYEKGELDYLRSFDLQKVANASKSLCVSSANLTKRGIKNIEDSIECKSEEEKLLQYNRRDCEIPVLILHESFKNPEIILNPEVRDDGKIGNPFVPVSSNNINDMINRERGKRRYEIVVGWRTKTGKEVAPGTKGAHKVYEYVTLDAPPVYKDKNGKEREQPSIYKTFANNNYKWFGIQSEEMRMVNDHGDGEIEVHYNEEDHREIRQVSGGGMVGINYAYAFSRIKKDGNNVLVYDRDGSLKSSFKNHVIIHEDLSSAHPSQVNKRLFPQTAPQRATDKDIAEILIAMNSKSWRKNIQNPKEPFELIFNWKRNNGSNRYSGFGTFHLKNVRANGFKTDNGLNFVPCIPLINYKSEVSGDLCAKDIAKITLETWEKMKNLNDTVVIRNKVLRASELEVTCTFEELCIYQMFTDFEIVSATNVYVYRMGVCPSYVWDIFDFAGHRKVVYKEIKEYVKEHTIDEILDVLKQYNADLDESDYLYLKSHPDDVEYAENALTRIKGIFNGIYGLMYQSPIHRQIEIGINEFGLTEKNVHNEFSARTKRNYLVGMYIAQWSRVDLALHLRHAIDNGCKVLYWATDSIYMIAPDGYDGRGLFNEQTEKMKDQRPNNNNLGGMDYEEYDKNQNRHLIQGFCMTQSLRNLIWFENKYGVLKCKTTFSGANTESLFPISKDPHIADDFDYCCERMLSENLCISPFENNKNAKKIADDGTYNLLPQGVKLNDLNNIDYVLSKTVTYALQNGLF